MNTTRNAAPSAVPLTAHLAHEGRRLAANYDRTLKTWLACYEVSDALPAEASDAVREKGQDISDAFCSLACDAQDAMQKFVLRVTGRVPLTPDGSGVGGDDIYAWPPAAILLDHVLWVVSQDGNADRGVTVLSRVDMPHAVNLDPVQPEDRSLTREEITIYSVIQGNGLDFREAIRRLCVPLATADGPSSRRGRNPFAAPGRGADEKSLLGVWRSTGTSLVEASQRLCTPLAAGSLKGGDL